MNKETDLYNIIRQQFLHSVHCIWIIVFLEECLLLSVLILKKEHLKVLWICRKKFQISKVASGAKFKNYLGFIEWLNDAGMINICYCLHTADLPLKGNCDESKYKIYFKDTGLLIANLDEESKEEVCR